MQRSKDEAIIEGRVQSGQKMVIRLQRWRLLSKGESHLVLEEVQQGGKIGKVVLRVCMHPTDTLSQQIKELYKRVITNSGVNKFVLPQHRLLMDREAKKALLLYIRQKLSFQVKQQAEVYVCEHLTRPDSGFTHSLQFKPKTPLPDYYSPQFIDKIKHHQKSTQDFLVQLKQRPQTEKTRWFKKNAHKQKKKNHNPMDVYHLTQSPPLYSSNIQSLTKASTNIPIKPPVFNETIHQYVKKSGILEESLRLQKLYLAPNDKFQSALNEVWSDLEDPSRQIIRIHNQIEQEISRKENPLATVKDQLRQAPCSPETNYGSTIQQMIRFLVSWSWRDISVILRFNLHSTDGTPIDIQATIIDYQLKQAGKLLSTPKKDAEYLRNYIEHTLSLPESA